MRGDDLQQDAMFSYVSPAQRVPKDHPLRPIRRLVDEALKAMSPQFARLYSHTGRPSIPPEKLLRALLLQTFYSIRSERLLMEQLEYNLLFRWFVGLNMDDAVWDASVFSKNRDRLLEGEIAQTFLREVLEQADGLGFLSDEHFTVDGTMIQAWASQKSFQKKDAPAAPSAPDDAGNPTVDFRGEKRSNATHESKTDPEARLYKKATGQEARLAYLGHILMENRHGLAVEACVSPATGTAEREAAITMLADRETSGRMTVGADKAYDVKEFVDQLRQFPVTPHVAQNTTNRSSAIDGRTTRHPGYTISQRIRKRVEEIFGWLKTVGPARQTKLRGRERVDWMFTLAVAAYNLIRMRNLMQQVSG